jgi:hypothetical protein
MTLLWSSGIVDRGAGYDSLRAANGMTPSHGYRQKDRFL